MALKNFDGGGSGFEDQKALNLNGGRRTMTRGRGGQAVPEGEEEDKSSPRPLQLSRSVDGSCSGKKTLPYDLKESLRVLAKLREAPWYFNDAGERSRSSCESKEGSLFSSAARDAPRFSYDGREQN
ncbi:hypothetical protein U1Q18_005364 [Sarracenia purpurea var. burkii]